MARPAWPTRLQCPTLKGITAIHHQMLENCLKIWKTFNVQGTLKGSHMQFCDVDKQECGCLVLCCTASAFKHAPEPATLLFVTSLRDMSHRCCSSSQQCSYSNLGFWASACRQLAWLILGQKRITTACCTCGTKYTIAPSVVFYSNTVFMIKTLQLIHLA